jgi:putative ATP-dependent endonuclease of OLD family
MAISINQDGLIMKVAKLHIENFRGIKESTLLFLDHVVLIGDNNVGKSTVFEALDLVLGRTAYRVVRR